LPAEGLAMNNVRFAGYAEVLVIEELNERIQAKVFILFHFDITHD
jgi:ethanolamine ammonia-lyase small subunit